MVTTILSLDTQYEINHTVFICKGETYTEGSSVYSETGVYENVYVASVGCDSVVTTYLTVGVFYSATNLVSICPGESYLQGSSSYDSTGVYTDVYMSQAGCDSTIITELTVLTIPSVTHEVTVCEGSSYTEGNSIYTDEGTYTDVYQSFDSCDSLVITILTWSSEILVNNDVELCQGDSYFEGSSEYSVAGIYEDAYMTNSGCDIIVTTNLSVVLCCTDEYIYRDVTMCEGSSYSEGSSFYVVAGVYEDAYPMVNGCDSIVVTKIALDPIYSIIHDVSLCPDQQYVEGGSIYDESRTYTDIYQTVNGCDSMITTVLTIQAPIVNETTSTICEGETYTYGNTTYDSTGIYSEILESQLDVILP